MITTKCKTWLKIGVLALVVVGLLGAMIGYDRGFREHPQPDWVTSTPEMRFKYGSIGAENDAGIPYWIFYVLPRVFPEKLTQDGKVIPGGYAALGVPWEQGRELRRLPHDQLPRVTRCQPGVRGRRLIAYNQR